jgi:phosphoribosylformimino-5-aminoimidazole carboxamide ribotide isomerase
VIGVLDLAAGRAVHARAGMRELYAPVRAVAGSPIEPGDALALARAYTDRLGVTELYAADLDAIDVDDVNASDVAHGRTSHATLVAEVAALGAPLWLDAGISSADRARRALSLGAARIVVGLETLPSYAALEEICAVVGGDCVAFSLDLRDGKPVASPRAVERDRETSPHLAAARAADAGVGSVIVIDLARVGTGTGLDLALVSRVREAVPGLTLVVGGGVRGLEDVARLADAGCDGVLVASALHDGRLGAAEVATARRWMKAPAPAPDRRCTSAP